MSLLEADTGDVNADVGGGDVQTGSETGSTGEAGGSVKESLLADSKQEANAESGAQGDAKTEGTGQEQGTEEAKQKAFSIELPDTFSEADKIQISTYAQSLNLTEYQAKQFSQIAKESQARAQADFDKQKASWERDVKNDPEIGGERLNENLNLAKVAVKQFDKSGNVMSLLNDSGFGSHPDVLRFLVSVGEAMAEDSFSGGDANSRKKPNVLDIMYKD